MGLLCMWMRVWSRIRRKVCAQWEAEHPLPEFWGKDSNISCDRAAYIHNLLLGLARERKFDVASVYFDISKFYERMSHELLLKAAQGCDLSPGLLRALCVLYEGPRRAKGATP